MENVRFNILSMSRNLTGRPYEYKIDAAVRIVIIYAPSTSLRYVGVV